MRPHNAIPYNDNTNISFKADARAVRPYRQLSTKLPPYKFQKAANRLSKGHKLHYKRSRFALQDVAFHNTLNASTLHVSMFFGSLMGYYNHVVSIKLDFT